MLIVALPLVLEAQQREYTLSNVNVCKGSIA